MSSPARQKRNLWRSNREKLKKQFRYLFADRSACPANKAPDGSDTPRTKQSAGEIYSHVLRSFLGSSDLCMARVYRKFADAPERRRKGRARDLLPLPFLGRWPAEIDPGTPGVNTSMHIANVCIAGLNCLHVGIKDAYPGVDFSWKPSAAQTTAHLHICAQVVRFLERLDEHLGDNLPWQGSFGHCEAFSSASYEDIRSGAVDLPLAAATCDPCKLIPGDFAEGISDGKRIFPSTSKYAVMPGQPTHNHDQEYILLTIRELRCGKLRLRADVDGLGGVFAVAKSQGRQRKVWDGSELSSCALKPPKPRRLANPSSFLDLEIEPEGAVFFSKRDASTFFDCLQVPTDLRRWFGQPPVQVGKLLENGLSLAEVRGFCDEMILSSITRSTVLYPVHVVWPMGFSWSSAVAQETTMAMCFKAGIAEECILSLEDPPPACFDEVCFVATDDTVLVHTNKERGALTLARLDAAFQACGVPRNVNKDVSVAQEVTALGCDLTNGPVMAQPSRPKIAACVCRTLDLLHKGRSSPKGFHALLGVWEWFALLQRPFFSIYSSVYDFVRREPAKRTCAVPNSALDELLITLALAPLLSVRLDKQPLNFLTASDAAPQYGFGVTMCPCSPADAREVCRLAERRGDYVRLEESSSAAEISRLGTPRRLKYKQSSFKTVLSCKAKWPAHSGVLEAHAYLLSLRWVARKAANHHRKVPFLVDAKVVVGAATKGRSSARALRTVLRSAAALGGCRCFTTHCLYPQRVKPCRRTKQGKTCSAFFQTGAEDLWQEPCHQKV